VIGVELPVGSGYGDPVVVRLDVAGVTHTFRVHVDGPHVDVESALGHVALTRRPRLVDPAELVAEGSLLAPMPGSVIDVRVGVGDHVSEGDTLVVMEAMKMQHAIAAPAAGVVVELGAEVGSQVDAGTVLAVVDADATETLELAHEGETP